VTARKFLFLTGSRGEWGYIRPLLRECARAPDLEYRLCVTNMHLVPAFGQTIKEIESDGFTVHHRVHMSLDGYSHATMAKSLGIFLASFVDIISSERPDWLILAGDRGEQLMGAIGSAFCYIPIAHIQAGELSGNIDGMTRHAIGKFSHFHFASNSDAAERLRKLGEQEFRIHEVGAPQLDEIVQQDYSDTTELSERLGFDVKQPYFLLVQHPVTADFQSTEGQIRETLVALNKLPQPKVVILPNNDAGSLFIRKGIEEYRHGEYVVFSNLRRQDFLQLLASCSCLVGNSSAGLLEAPTLKVPVVNLGRRQEGRVRASNVIDTDFDSGKIVDAIRIAISREFKDTNLAMCVNPYGDGRTASRIITTLCETSITDALLSKNLTY
jgi:GDP/UDP-N,N'-diacetylbacillosamine 2-epimerase (hydrolysing)